MNTTPALSAGAARVDITPTDLTALNPIGGGTFDSVHDPLSARALVIGDGVDRVALVSLEVIEVGDTTAIRARVARETGIAADHVLLVATHTHSAPRVGEVSPGALSHGGGAEVAAYTEFVTERIVEAVREAARAARPARIGTGTGTVDVNVCRDLYTDAGWSLGFAPDGPSDKTLWVMRVEGLDGEPIAFLLNYAVHSTVTLWTGVVSADLAGVASRYVEHHHGGDAVALWTCGALGDQNPRISFENDRTDAFVAAEAQGVMVGAEALRVSDGITGLRSDDRVHVAERVVPLPTKRGVDVMADMEQADVDTVDLRLALLRLGDTAIGGISGEVTTQIGTGLRRAAPLRDVVLVSLVNDRIGYIPEDSAYDRPTHCVNGAPIRRGFAEKAIVDGIVAMIDTA